MNKFLFFLCLPAVAFCDCQPDIYVCKNDINGKEVDDEKKALYTFIDRESNFLGVCNPSEDDGVTWSQKNVRQVCVLGVKKMYALDSKNAEKFIKNSQYNPLKCLKFDEEENKCKIFAGESEDFKQAEEDGKKKNKPQFLKNKNIERNWSFLKKYYINQ